MSDTIVQLDLQDGFAFKADFGLRDVPPLRTDEPEPLGVGSGPNPAALLATAVGNCMAASLLFCLRRARIDVIGMSATAQAITERNDAGRMRIERIVVRIEPHVAEADLGRIDRCLTIFEDYCVVTQSVRAGIDVDVTVEPHGVPHAAAG